MDRYRWLACFYVVRFAAPMSQVRIRRGWLEFSVRGRGVGVVSPLAIAWRS